MDSPLEYSFDEIKVGLKHNFEVSIDEELTKKFANISGDFNPLHMDEKYAKETKFEKRVVHGMLLASFFSKLVGMYLPGKNALYFSQNINFVKPCFIGDKITVEGEIIDKSEATRIIKLKTSIKNQEEEALVEGTSQVIIR